MRQIVLYFFLFISTILLFSCKKYPEGGCERRGPKNIIGNWKLTLYEVNGIDSTDLINYNGSDLYKKIDLLKNASTISVNHAGFNGYTAKFIDKNQKIQFSGRSVASPINCVPSATNGSVYNCYRSFFIPEANPNSSCVWEIEKLTKKEIVLSTTQTNSYIIKLSK